MSRPAAVIVEERNAAGATWWTLFVRGGFALSASYETEADAIADAPFWVTGVAKVIPLETPSKER